MDKTVSFKSIEDVLDFAISEEEAAVKLYTRLAGTINDPSLKETLEAFADEEREHKATLEAVKRGELELKPDLPEVSYTDLADVLVDVDTSEDMNYKDVLVLAMRKEKAAYRLYTYLADQAESQDIADLFQSLAAQEANHKVRFEIAYEDWMERATE